MKTQLSRPARSKARYTEEYKQEALELWRNNGRSAAKVIGETMQAACNLAHWFGCEAVRIYAELAETREQREQRELCEFIERRRGIVRVRDLMQSYTPLKNQKEKAESALNELVKIGRGKWADARPDGAGRPTREFHLLRLSTSTQFGISRGKTENSVDVDAYNRQEIMPSGQRETQVVSGELDIMRASVLEL